MNIDFKNLKDNEWAIINGEGKMRIVKTDAESTEMAGILNKEDELESLQEEKHLILKDIAETECSLKENKTLGKFAILCFSIAAIIVIIVNYGFSVELIPSLGTGLAFLTLIEGAILLKHKSDKKLMAIWEERLQEVKEKEPELEKEIEKLKEKYNFKEEAKELNYLGYLSYKNNQEKRLVRTRTK